MTEEIWKSVADFEHRYEVSNQGRVRNKTTGKTLAPNVMRHGYLCAHLYDGKGRKSRQVRTIHQLVAQAFLPPRNEAREVNHINFDRRDNRVENLEWVTRRENVLHAIKNGRRTVKGNAVKGIHVKTGVVVRFNSQLDAEIALRGKQTGGISGAMKRNKPIYGYVWWRA